jgi:dTMP kinase
MAKSLFVVLDGIDGSGKSEMIRLLYNYFSENKDYRVLKTQEPTNGKYGSEVRKILREEENPLKNAEKLLDLFVKDREEHLKNTILPFLESSDGDCNIVICDRYYYSTIVFQHTQGLDIKRIINANKDFRKPDVAFVLDIPAETALERIKDREKEKFEKLDFMKKLRKNFLELRDYLDDKIIIIDASKLIEDVFESIKKEVEHILRSF